MLQVTLWTLAWLAVADVAINLTLDPARPWAGKVVGLSRYFNHGRSIEGKLLDAIGPQADRPNAIVRAGWIDPAEFRQLASAPKAGDDMLVAVYGQSFAFNAASAMERIDGRMTLRLVGGPGAPLSHSFAALRTDLPLRRADVVVIGILASSLAKSESISGLSWTFESPAPFTFPRYSLSDGKLVEEAPVIRTEQEFRAAFREQGAAWADFKQQLSRSDVGYDSFAFNRSLLDHSAIGRLIRRGWVAHHQSYPMNASDPEARTFDAERVALTSTMIGEMKRSTDQAHERMVVLLLHDRGYDRALYEALGKPLQRMGIEYVSTHALFSSRDPGRFAADGHFTESTNELVAQALHALVRGRQLPAAARPATVQAP